MKANDKRIPKEIRTGKRPAGTKRLHKPTKLEQSLLDMARCRNDGGPSGAQNSGPDGAGIQGIDVSDLASLIDGDGNDGGA